MLVPVNITSYEPAISHDQLRKGPVFQVKDLKGLAPDLKVCAFHLEEDHDIKGVVLYVYGVLFTDLKPQKEDS